MWKPVMRLLTLALVTCTGLAQSPAIDWSTGVAYAYDGSGNIKTIGADTFRYDGAGRLIEATTNGITRTYTYDRHGNRTNCSELSTGDCQNGITVDPTTNRLNQASYDGAGNVTALNGHAYAYDALQMQTGDAGGVYTREYLYTADDERIAVHNVGGGWSWTIRDTSGKVLREFTSHDNATSGWQWTKDYIHRDGLLLATRQREPGYSSPTTYHYHLDHLGTPRRITNQSGQIVGVHDYHPFGPELSGGVNEPAPSLMKFTGHERDVVGAESVSTLDYMHARYYSPSAGRFLSVDPVLDQKLALKSPQAWNRYAYVRNNPVGAVDPTGMLEALLYGQVHDVNAGDVVVLVNKKGQAKHVAIVAGFVKGKTRPEALIYENAPANKHGSLQDRTPHTPQLINSNSPRAGAGIWNGRTLSVGGIAENKAPMFGLRYLSLARFSPSDVSRAVRSIGPVQYDNRAWGSLGTTCDCAGFVNQVVNALDGSLSGNYGYMGPGKTISNWLREASDDD